MKSYAAWAEDKIRMNSFSGGAFRVLAEYILESNGVVCGVEMNNELQVRHILVNSKKDLERIQKSKYVQSDVSYAYREVSKALKERKKYYLQVVHAKWLQLKVFYLRRS